MQKSVNNILGWIIIVYLSIMLLFLLVWFFPGNDKWNYRSYKQYENKIDNKLQETLAEIEKDNTRYYQNEISKRQMIWRLNKASKDLGNLYDSFKWKRGDRVTKELFVIKKQIIIDYAQIYDNRAISLEKGIKTNEAEEIEYIKLLIDRYNLKDKLQREKFNLPF